MRILTIFLIVLCAGCAPLTGTTPGDSFTSAAMSWVGADIQEMLAVWPNPNRKCGANVQGEAGCARWTHEGGSVSSWSRYANGYRCDTVAYYDADGTIKSMDVKRSRGCDERFGELIEAWVRRR